MKLPLHLPGPPRPLVALLLLGAITSLVPLTLFLMHSTSYHREPRIHLWQDMDNQVKHRAQSASALFADGRAMRPAVPGAVGRGHLGNDDHLVRGFELIPTGGTTPVQMDQSGAGGAGESGAQGSGAGNASAGQGGVPNPEEPPAEPGVETRYFAGFPEGIEVDELFVRHGQQRYDAMCSLCHGLDGRGNGPVHQRSQQLMTSGRGLGTAWVQPANLVAVTDGQLTYGRDLYPEGELYNTIALGKGNMTGYAHAIDVEDRWAIVAYIRALQEAQEGKVLAEAARAAAAPEEEEAAPEIPAAIANPPSAGVDSGKGKDALPGVGADSSTDASAADDAEEDASAAQGPTQAIGSE